MLVFSFASFFSSPAYISFLPSVPSSLPCLAHSETSFALARQPQIFQPPHSTMKLLSAFATASLATAALYAREDVVTTIVTTLAEESTTYVVVDGQTEETVVSGTPSVVEVAAVL